MYKEHNCEFIPGRNTTDVDHLCLGGNSADLINLETMLRAHRARRLILYLHGICVACSLSH